LPFWGKKETKRAKSQHEVSSGKKWKITNEIRANQRKAKAAKILKKSLALI
jgi:hypothetical protein